MGISGSLCNNSWWLIRRSEVNRFRGAIHSPQLGFSFHKIHGCSVNFLEQCPVKSKSWTLCGEAESLFATFAEFYELFSIIFCSGNDVTGRCSIKNSYSNGSECTPYSKHRTEKNFHSVKKWIRNPKPSVIPARSTKVAIPSISLLSVLLTMSVGFMVLDLWLTGTNVFTVFQWVL